MKLEKNKARDLRNSQWWKLKLAQGFCHYCEQRFSKDKLTMDHIVPIARGGKSTRGNVVVCCKDCNTAKGRHIPVESSLENLSKK